MMRLITAQVDSEQWYKFKTVCKRNKTNASKEIRKLIDGDYHDEMERLYDWLMDDNREPAQTFFTSGTTRNVAKEIEFKLNKK